MQFTNIRMQFTNIRMQFMILRSYGTLANARRLGGGWSGCWRTPGALLAEALPECCADASGKHTQIQIRPDADGICNSRRDVEGLVGPLVDSGVLLVEALPECGADARNVDGRADMIQFVRQVRHIDEQLLRDGTMHDPIAMPHRLML